MKHLWTLLIVLIPAVLSTALVAAQEQNPAAKQAAPSPTATAVAGHVIQAKSVEYADVSAAVKQADNTHTPTGKALRFDGGRNCSTMEGRDYINLGNGRPADTIPDEVQKFYTAEVNGVAYVGEFTYPHPLRGGSAPTP